MAVKELEVSLGNGKAAKKVEAVEEQVPEHILAKADPLISNYKARLIEMTEAYMHRQEAAAVEAGEPTLASGYQYWNCLTAGPYQFFNDPPYRPGKIIAAGEWTLIMGVVWVNPANSDGGGLPGTVVLGDRNYRVSFETINLSTVSNGPDRRFAGKFGNTADVINVFYWWFRPQDPGINPALFETNLTADIVQIGQPMAAFSTWHLDPDVEPGFLGRPTVGPRWQHDTPMRYLVYRK